MSHHYGFHNDSPQLNPLKCHIRHRTIRTIWAERWLFIFDLLEYSFQNVIRRNYSFFVHSKRCWMTINGYHPNEKLYFLITCSTFHRVNLWIQIIMCDITWMLLSITFQRFQWGNGSLCFKYLFTCILMANITTLNYPCINKA